MVDSDKNSLGELVDSFYDTVQKIAENPLDEGIKKSATLIFDDIKNRKNNIVNTFDTMIENLKEQKEYSSMIMENLEKLNEKNGVSLDKEMVNLLRYQRAYEAAAKVIQTSDEILKTTLSLKS